MTDALAKPCTAFAGEKQLSSGPMIEVALAIKSASESGVSEPILAFDDMTGRAVDFDLRGTESDIATRLSEQLERNAATSAPCDAPVSPNEMAGAGRGRGRPKLGVTAREVTLLPRHWDWLAAQPGGASAALRRLVEEARKNDGDRTRIRAGQDAAYRFMAAMAGNLPGFEEAARALYAGDRVRLKAEMAPWPDDIRDYAMKLAFGPAEVGAKTK